MKKLFGAICCCFAALACSTSHADLVLGDVVGIDFSNAQGGNVTNWNTVDVGSGSLAAGTITGTDVPMITRTLLGHSGVHL